MFFFESTWMPSYSSLLSHQVHNHNDQKWQSSTTEKYCYVTLGWDASVSSLARVRWGSDALRAWPPPPAFLSACLCGRSHLWASFPTCDTDDSVPLLYKGSHSSALLPEAPFYGFLHSFTPLTAQTTITLSSFKMENKMLIGICAHLPFCHRHAARSVTVCRCMRSRRGRVKCLIPQPPLHSTPNTGSSWVSQQKWTSEKGRPEPSDKRKGLQLSIAHICANKYTELQT